MSQQGWGKVSDIASYAGVGRRTVYGWMRSGMPFSRLPSGRILIAFKHVDEFLAGFIVDGPRDTGIVEELLESLGE